MDREPAYHPLVADDLAAAIRRYESISPVLADRFRTAIRNRLADIATRPEWFGIMQQGLRAAIVHRFPYVILFSCREERVLIVGVFHARSDRGPWFERSG
jgi:plasmid stabilization system protein ParE